MNEQLSNSLVFTCFFTTSGIGTAGLTVTCSIINPAGTVIVSNGACSDTTLGFYQYTLAGASTGTEGEYKARFHTATTTVDQQDLSSLWVVGRAGVEYLDATVSSRLAPTVAARTLDVAATGEAGLDFNNIYDATGAHTLTNITVPTTTTVTNTVPADLKTITAGVDFSATMKSSITAAVPTVISIAAGVWDETLTDHLSAGSTGNKLNSLCCTLGSGAVNYTYTVTDSLSGLAIPDVIVTVTSDLAGLTVIAQGVTNATGLVTFWLDHGTYYFWLSRSGYIFQNPDVEVV